MNKESEEYKDLRMAVFEAKRDNSSKTFREIAEEFNISQTEARNMVFEYCKHFNHPAPSTEINFQILNKANEDDELRGGLTIICENYKGKIIRVMDRTFTVYFEKLGARMVRKDTLKMLES